MVWIKHTCMKVITENSTKFPRHVRFRRKRERAQEFVWVPNDFENRWIL